MDFHPLAFRIKNQEIRDCTWLGPEGSEWPLILERGLGSTVWDHQGREFLDLCMGFGVLNLGHHPDYQKKVWRSCYEGKNIIHGMGDVFASRAKLDLIEKLLSLMPSNFSRVGLCISGSQAVEYALKSAIIATGHSGVIAFEQGYHGLDLGALAVTHRADFRKPFSSWPGLGSQVVFSPYLETKDQVCSSLDKSLAELSHNGHQPAALLLEPIQGRAGGRAFSMEVLQEISRWCQMKNVCLIFDEIFVGLGRTGRWSFSHEIDCDIICLGKALGGGLPISAIVGRPEILDAWPSNQGEALHTGTFFGHPLACQMAFETLREFERLELPQLCLKTGQVFATQLRVLSQKYDFSLRDYGLHLTLDFKQIGMGAEIFTKLLKHGIITLPSGSTSACLSITPSVFLTELEQERFITAVETVLA